MNRDTDRPLSVVILAAGEGSRMRSRLPKVLHPLAGRPLLGHVIDAARALAARRIVVVHGHGGDRVQEAFPDTDLGWAEQAEQLGTGHAVAQALPLLGVDETVLILYGDVPLIAPETLERLLAACAGNHLALLTVELDDPAGYGRILRDTGGNVTGIVEEKDATPEQRAIREVNTGIMALPAGLLGLWLPRLGNDNAQGEYYLTDLIAMAVEEGVAVQVGGPAAVEEVLGVNTRAQLARLERAFQRRQAEALMAAGVTLLDPARFDVRGKLTAGRDVVIDVNVVIEGEVELGEGVYVGPGCVLRDCVIGEGVEIRAHSVIESAAVGAGSRVGPFARLRPGAELAAGVHVGNFVEIKQSRVGEGSKINHLAYVGDSDIGRGVNIGAGTITCNYDGAHKHRTVIGDRVFVGSDTQLVAPVSVGDDATIGAGSTITRDVPPGGLTLSRAPQRTVSGWKRPVKKKT